MENFEKFRANHILIDFMVSKGLDENQIAKKIGKNPSTIYRITAKSTTPHKATMIAIAKAYSLRPDYFFSADKVVDQPDGWKHEAYQNLKSEVEYLRALLLVASKKGLFTLGTGVKRRELRLS